MDNCNSAPDVVALRPFVPAKNFDTCLRFYTDLGFKSLRLGEGVASMHLGPFAFLLQFDEREDFAEHLMIHLLVKDLEAWWARIAALDLAGRYGVRPPARPTLQSWSLVAYVWDPTGVLWHIA